MWDERGQVFAVDPVGWAGGPARVPNTGLECRGGSAYREW